MTARRRGWPEENKLATERGPGPLEFDEMPPAWLDEVGELFHRYCDEIDASVACRIAILAHEIGYTIGTFHGKELSAKDRVDLLRSVRVLAKITIDDCLERGAKDARGRAIN